MKHLRHMALAAVMLLAPTAAMADEVLLTVTVSGTAKTYDRAALEAFERVEFSTSTMWTDGVQQFAGVPLSAILDDAGVTSGTIRATAINDYAADIPVSEVSSTVWPIVAYERNGAEMSVRDKGPLWIVYPYDTDPAYRSEIVFSRSVWQLVRLEIVE